LAYTEAAFWSMVWRNWVVKLDESDVYDGSRNEAAENAAARRLPMVNAAFDAGKWSTGADLLLPVGAPSWAAYPGEPERLLAFRSDNCRGTSAAWNRLLSYRLEQLPEELANIIRTAQQRQDQEEARQAAEQRRNQEEAENRYKCARQEEADRKNVERERWEDFKIWFNKRNAEGKPK
jgi:hypothetical protein